LLSARALSRIAFGLFVLGAIFIAQALYIPAKAVLAQILLERAFARTIATGVPQRPWPWADMTPEARLLVPRLGIDAIVLTGASGQAMAFGPGRMPNTRPLGAPGTTIIAAHRDTSFSFLKALVPGDVIDAETADGKHHRFRVAASRIVRANASGLDPADAGPAGARLALVTCYPFDGVLHSPWRYVVIADRILGDRTMSGA
jgi:sortase A